MIYLSIFIESICIAYSLLKIYVYTLIKKISKAIYVLQNVDTAHGGMVAVWISLLPAFCSAVLKFFSYKYYVLILQWKVIFNFTQLCTNKLDLRKA